MKKTCEHSGVEIDEREGYPDTNFISSDEVKELVELRKKHAALLEANKKLVEALEFYEQRKHIRFNNNECRGIKIIPEGWIAEPYMSSCEMGMTAREALKKYGEVK